MEANGGNEVSIGELFAAVSAAQEEIVGALKDSDNPFFKSKYADLASVQDAIRKPFAKNGLCVIQTMEPMEGGFILVTTLGHKSGAFIASRLPVHLSDTKPQVVGSQITYARRYALAAIAGVAQIDDDGEAAHGRVRATEKAVAPVSADVRAVLEDAAKRGLETFRESWKTLTKEHRESAQGDKEWFAKLKATAESNAKPGA